MNEAINELLAEIPASTGSDALASLDPETVAILTEFEAWLQTSDPVGVKTQSTARAYKCYVAGAIAGKAAGKVWADHSTDVRSGVKAFQRFVEATSASDVEDEVLEDVAEGYGDTEG